MKQVESLIEGLINDHNIFSARLTQTRQWSAYFWTNEAASLLSLSTPDLPLGHGDCAVKLELYGFLRL